MTLGNDRELEGMEHPYGGNIVWGVQPHLPLLKRNASMCEEGTVNGQCLVLAALSTDVASKLAKGNMAWFRLTQLRPFREHK